MRQEAGAAEIAAALTWTSRAAHLQLDLAQDVCERWPVLHTALAGGHIDVPKARVICDALSGLDDTLAGSLVEQILTVASGLTTAQIARKLRHLIAKADPAAMARRRQTATQERRLWHYPDRDGTASIGAAGLPIQRAAAAEERITAIARAARAAGDSRTIQQLRVDTFLDLLEGNGPAAAPGVRKGVVELTVPMTALTGGNEPGGLAGWGPVPADVARQIAAQQTDAVWRLSIHDTDATLLYHGGSTLRSNPTARRPDAATTRSVIARDRTCRFPGCSIPARRTDIDHTIPHAHGGQSTVDNLGCLCRTHHRIKHETGWKLTQPKPGHFRWRSPLRQIHYIRPDPD